MTKSHAYNNKFRQKHWQSTFSFEVDEDKDWQRERRSEEAKCKHWSSDGTDTRQAEVETFHAASSKQQRRRNKNLSNAKHKYYTVNHKAETTHKQHILKSTITVRSIEPVVRNFCSKSSNFCTFQFLCREFFYQSSGRKTFTFPKLFNNNFRPIFKLDVFNFEN